jgi:hypothetical protein
MIAEANELIHDFAQYAGTHEGEDYLSLYLNVDPSERVNQTENPAWRIFLKNAIDQFEAEMDPVQTRQWKKVRLSDQSPETAWARTRKRLDSVVNNYRPEGKTLVVFVSPGASYSYELPVKLDNAVYFGRPHVQDFLWALDEYEQHLALLMTEDQARALLLSLGQTTAEVEVTSDEAWIRSMHKSAKSSKIDDRQDELDSRFIRDIATRMEKFFLQNRDLQRVVLGGNTTMANALRGVLHPAVQERVIAILPIPFEAAPHEIADRMREPAKAAERDHELALVNDIIGQAKSTGRGVLGYEAVTEASNRAAIQVLALMYPDDAEQVEPLLLNALQAGAQIEFVRGEASDVLGQNGRIAARLYYAM